MHDGVVSLIWRDAMNSCFGRSLLVCNLSYVIPILNFNSTGNCLDVCGEIH